MKLKDLIKILTHKDLEKYIDEDIALSTYDYREDEISKDWDIKRVDVVHDNDAICITLVGTLR